VRYKTERPSFYPEIGDNIRMARLRQRVSQRELGKRLGVSHAAISYIERAVTRLDIDNLAVIADALGVPLCQIVVLDRTRRAGRDG
jgi:transcriptional regulator with XRE-family HTH domain